MLAQSALGNLQTHIGTALGVRTQQFPQEAGRDGRKDSDPERAALASARRSRGIDRVLELHQCKAGSVQEATSSGSQPYTARIPLKERDPEPILKGPDTPAHGGLADTQDFGCTTKAQALGDDQPLCDRHEIDARPS